MANPSQSGNSADLRISFSGEAPPEVRVTSIDGVEQLSRLFLYRVGVVAAEPIELEPLLDRDAHIEIDTQRGTRQIHGIVRGASYLGRGSGVVHYEFDIAPPHWLLTQRRNSRVFNAKRCAPMDVIGIARKVLLDSAVPDSAITTVALGKLFTHEFVVQYRESNWHFIKRLLEEEGLYFHFDHSQGECRMVVVDSMGAHAPFDGATGVVPFRDPQGATVVEEHIFEARRRRRIRSGSVMLDDFDFRGPGKPMRVDAMRERFVAFTDADYPGRYSDVERGRALARTRIEAHQCRRAETTFKTTVRDLAPGARFLVNSHPDAELNDEYLATRVRITATQPQSGEADAVGGEGGKFIAVVSAIPTSVPYRSPLRTRRPIIAGSQTAIVVGPPSEEIHVDEYGRVEVRFHWDEEARHDVGASCWIRVSQGMAGGQYGMMFLPRVGQEVIVDFLEGDPDRPIVTGRVYNRDHMPPYKLPENKTISTIRTCSSKGAKGGNEIRFEDAKGQEQLLLFGKGSVHIRAGGNTHASTGGDAHETVEGDSFERVSKNKHSIVNLDLCEHVKGSVFEQVEGDLLTGVLKRLDLWVGEDYSLLGMKDILLSADGSLTLWCQGNYIKINAAGIQIVGKSVNINSGGDGADGKSRPGKVALEAIGAAGTEYGHNVRYDHDAGHDDHKSDSDDRKTSWIEIELLDDAGMPIRGETYAIRLPSGEERRGTLDEHGQAHVAVPSAGECQISFPNLDAAAWEKVS